MLLPFHMLCPSTRNVEGEQAHKTEHDRISNVNLSLLDNSGPDLNCDFLRQDSFHGLHIYGAVNRTDGSEPHLV